MSSPLLFLTVFGISTLLLLISLRRIPEGHAYTLRRVGGHMRTVGAGFHVVLPLIERVAHKISLLGNIVQIEGLRVPQRDESLRGQVYFQVLDAGRADAIIDQVAVLVNQRLPELMVGPPEEDATARNQRMKLELNRSLRERGLMITRVQLSVS